MNILYGGVENVFIAIPEDDVWPDIIHRLHISDIRFLLSGSRFLGQVHADSDWDLAANINTLEKEEELKSLGFKEEDFTKENLFGGVQRVFSYEDEEAEVHVLDVGPLQKRAIMQTLIHSYFPNGYTDKKNNAKCIWNMVEKMYDLLERNYFLEDWINELKELKELDKDNKE